MAGQRDALSRLENLAKDGDQQAMTLLGKVLFQAKAEKEALLWLRKATHPPTGNLEFDGAGDALVTQGRILISLGERTTAQVLFEMAAKELHDPEAYFHLSQMESEGSANQLGYLLKAASMGVTEACHNLGVIELNKIKSKPPVDGNKEYGMAQEWFLIAAKDQYLPSIMNLAIIDKDNGRITEANEWLKKAEVLSGYSKEVKLLQHEINAATKTLI